jgi:hypothetical protein
MVEFERLLNLVTSEFDKQYIPPQVANSIIKNTIYQQLRTSAVESSKKRKQQ